VVCQEVTQLDRPAHAYNYKKSVVLEDTVTSIQLSYTVQNMHKIVDDYSIYECMNFFHDFLGLYILFV